MDSWEMDTELKIINKKYPNEFESAVNSLLAEKCWRVTNTEISVADHHYFAILIKTENHKEEIDRLKADNATHVEISVGRGKQVENQAAEIDRLKRAVELLREFAEGIDMGYPVDVHDTLKSVKAILSGEGGE
jgi:transcriptional regulatory protein LevR